MRLLAAFLLFLEALAWLSKVELALSIDVGRLKFSSWAKAKSRRWNIGDCQKAFVRHARSPARPGPCPCQPKQT